MSYSQPLYFQQKTPPAYSQSVMDRYSQSSTGAFSYDSSTENVINNWLAETSYNSMKIDLSELNSNTYISYFGTKELGFDRNNNDSNGFAWLSNYYVAKSHNLNSNQVFDFKIKAKIGQREYEASNVEVFYQMFKLFLDPNQQQKDYNTFVRFSPDQARNEARNKNLRPAGNNFRKLDQYMEHLIEQKFFNHNLLAKSLLSTQDKFLFEGNKWGDARFGMSFGNIIGDENKLEGENKLGKMLMKTRTKLQGKKDSDINFANFVNNPVTTYQAWVSIKPMEDF